MKVALTVWEGRISPVFDVSREVVVLTVQQGAVIARAVERLGVLGPEQRAARLADLGVGTVICGAISGAPYQELVARGLRVFGFVAGEVEEVVAAFLAGRLPSPAFSMPGCGGWRHRRRGAGSGGRGRGRRLGRRGTR